jgi:hypothetical protein
VTTPGWERTLTLSRQGKHPVDVFRVEPICPGGLQFMGGVNGAGHVAFFAKSLSLSSVSLSGRPSNRKRNRADAALYIERILDTH